MEEKIEILEELETALNELKKEYVSEDINKNLVACGISLAISQVQKKAIDITIKQLGLKI